MQVQCCGMEFDSDFPGPPSARGSTIHPPGPCFSCRILAHYTVNVSPRNVLSRDKWRKMESPLKVKASICQVPVLGRRRLVPCREATRNPSWKRSSIVSQFNRMILITRKPRHQLSPTTPGFLARKLWQLARQAANTGCHNAVTALC